MINKEKIDELCQRALTKFGQDRQIIKIIEEMSELTKILCKCLLDREIPSKQDSIIGEMADIELMLYQIKMNFGIESLVENRKKIKWIELKNKLE